MTNYDWHKTQIYYNNWVIPGQLARVRSVSGGIEFEVKNRVYAWLTHTSGKKLVACSTVRQVVLGRNAMVIEFDLDDQIFLRNEVLQDLPGLRIERNLLGSDTDLMKSMLANQERLGGVSWLHGRSSASKEKLSWGEVGWLNMKPAVVAVTTVIGSVSLKLAICGLTGWWC
jgi:hypothetical protein